MKGLLVILTVVFLGFYTVADAEEGVMDHNKMMKSGTTTEATDSMEIKDAGNKKCPVMGGPVSEGNFVVYKGIKYGLCCSGCKDMFLKNPEKYIKILKDQGEIK